MSTSKALTFLAPKEMSKSEGAIFIDMGISAGFPSPADDFKETRISLDEELIKNKETTFFAKVSGQSMIGAGLDDNDLLVIDRSIVPTNNKIAVCFLDGEFTVKRLRVTKDEIWLQPENPDYPVIKITEENNFIIWGIVTSVIKKV
ncbi:translesion error-prone DNA polymerase V autoproteolytic subunit [Tenacibaculum finnmarkense]|uniref:LexA family protein n=1 Tax=Tenacibaculum finnmarkense TaxID=2781243 RepID=UPI00187B4DC7|nr:translesion error-prone DNA polymerase V autoproteolytic subunit [Tenacibaculum finnmarkense]MBE7646994.1 translesion error-prone DNA polymerase V autoproteolytic subunit [Tenacibaculum finnmarkense genomovar ulcerans]MCD8399119.1 translesion error-prone DNA polymerase V autoproteolytic subunit [Tenacibaculum finnmarkense genomovar ulcerans]MCG8784596.1 translesion error-prone DNA polymerase V autoproteolytic subunit [Tenacibaculum finnmarkense]MCG8811712.1 translesion error-prone DNA polyme